MHLDNWKNPDISIIKKEYQREVFENTWSTGIWNCTNSIATLYKSEKYYVREFVEAAQCLVICQSFRRELEYNAKKTNQQHEFEYNAIKTNQEHAQFVFEGILYKVGKNTSMSMHQHMIKHSCIDFLTRHQRDVWNLKVFEQFTVQSSSPLKQLYTTVHRLGVTEVRDCFPKPLADINENGQRSKLLKYCLDVLSMRGVTKNDAIMSSIICLYCCVDMWLFCTNTLLAINRQSIWHATNRLHCW